MSDNLTRFIADRYPQFVEHLEGNWSVSFSTLSKYEPILKNLHRRFLSFACVCTITSERQKGNEYILSAIEVAFLSLIMGIKGAENTSCVLLRQIIELALKFIYFSTHPVEYSWATTGDGYKDLSFQRLLEYISRTAEYKILCQHVDICERLNFWYDSLSRHVHIQNKKYMTYRSLKPLTLNKKKSLDKVNERTRNIWPLLTLLLAVYFSGRYIKADIIEQRLIRMGLDRSLNNVLKRYLRDIS